MKYRDINCLGMGLTDVLLWGGSISNVDFGKYKWPNGNMYYSDSTCFLADHLGYYVFYDKNMNILLCFKLCPGCQNFDKINKLGSVHILEPNLKSKFSILIERRDNIIYSIRCFKYDYYKEYYDRSQVLNTRIDINERNIGFRDILKACVDISNQKYLITAEPVYFDIRHLAGGMVYDLHVN